MVMAFESSSLSEPSLLQKKDFDFLLRYMVNNGASDLQIAPGYPVRIEKNGVLVDITYRALTSDDCKSIISIIASKTMLPIVIAGQPLSTSYDIATTEDVNKIASSFRFRVEASALSFRMQDTVRVTLRYLPDNIPSLSNQNPPINDELLAALTPNKGLVLAVGTTASGKSTLLAGALRYIGSIRSEFILTYEDPIEFIYDPDILSRNGDWKATICQTEIGRHVKTWSEGLKSALRSAPKTMLIGELRDDESIKAGVEFVRTGHTLYSTMHVDGVAAIASEVANRTGGDIEMAARFINVLGCAVFQKLVKRKDGKGRIALREYIIMDTQAKDTIKEYLSNEYSIASIENAVAYLIKERGTDFLSCAKQAVKNNDISENDYLIATGVPYV